MVSKRDRKLIEAYVADYARELHDQAHLSSSLTRACRLYAESDVPLDAFLQAMQEARVLTQRASGGIRSELGDGSGRKSKMAYWFGVLEDLISRAA